VAPRAYWKGYLKLSLVSCPVALFPASSEREKISFNQINKKTGNRIRYRKVDAETEEEVDSSDIIKGYEVGKGTIDGRRTGTARPFPLWRLPSGPYSPPIGQILGSGIAPRPELAGHLTSVRLFSSDHPVNRISVATQCDLFATYRRLSSSAVSTICQC
jgi:hypothetical protein